MSTSKNKRKQNVQSKYEILVPFDFSESAKSSFSTAVQVAKVGDARITLFYVTSKLQQMIEKYYEGYSELSEAYEKGKRKLADEREEMLWELEKFAISHDIGEVSLRTVVAVGKFRDELEHYLDQNQSNIIVMGISEKNSLMDLLLGNKAEQAIRMSSIPVLAVREASNEFYLNKILMAIDLKEYEDSSVNTLRSFAEYLGAKVLITYVRHSAFEIPDKILRKLNEFAEKHQFKNYELHVLPTGETTAMLEEFAEEKGADVIATITKGANAFFKLIYGSQTDKLVEHSDKSILAINE